MFNKRFYQFNALHYPLWLLKLIKAYTGLKDFKRLPLQIPIVYKNKRRKRKSYSECAIKIKRICDNKIYKNIGLKLYKCDIISKCHVGNVLTVPLNYWMTILTTEVHKVSQLLDFSLKIKEKFDL